MTGPSSTAPATASTVPATAASTVPATAASTATLHQFNADEATARHILDRCLDIDAWVDDLAAGRPYPSIDALLARASEASARISWEQVATALARHPRIGEKSAGSAADADLSASEQAGVHAAEVEELAAGNRAYEARFGHIFLICASGLSGQQMLAALRRRVTNDDETERAVVISELRAIADLRLSKAVTP